MLAERFRHYFDESPMAYLTRWRLQLGAQMLSLSSHSVAQIAPEVGYESEADFQPCLQMRVYSSSSAFPSPSRSIHPGGSLVKLVNPAA